MNLKALGHTLLGIAGVVLPGLAAQYLPGIAQALPGFITSHVHGVWGVVLAGAAGSGLTSLVSLYAKSPQQ